MIRLDSQIDDSINLVEQYLTGFVESRYVRRTEDYFIAYLSSQTGCNRGCRFCHLTTTKQTKFVDVSPQEFAQQVTDILKLYEQHDMPKARYMHFNFMARGEPLNNTHLLRDSTELLLMMGRLAQNYGLFPKFNMSTIMPKPKGSDPDMRLSEIFPIITPTIYYSIYSVNPEWRRKWLPMAKPVNAALRDIREYQKLTKKTVKFHCCFIEGENDHIERDIVPMMKTIEQHNIQGEFNIVRYNPYSAEQGRESPEEHVQRIRDEIAGFMPVKIIPRVGEDVHASCGTFYTPED